MPWFKAEKQPDGTMVWDHWQWYGKGPKHDPDDILPNGHRDICSIYYPLIGPYDGRDPDVLEYHMLTAKVAGIDGFVADWYGPHSFADQVFGAMVAAAERCRMRLAICLEEKSFFPPYSQAKTRAEAMDVMTAQVEYVLARYARSSAYLRRNGLPVLFVFAGWEQTGLGPNTFSPEELTAIMRRFQDHRFLYVRGGVDFRYTDSARGCYLWSADGRPRDPAYKEACAARKSGQINYWVGGVCPGFNDAGVWGWGNGPRITDRRGDKEYRESWQDVLTYRPDAVQIITWNDFGEGTTIEPAEPYGFEFVNLTEQFVARFTGRRAYLKDNRWPYRIFQLRRKIETLPEGPDRKAWTRSVDRFVEALIGGRRWFMEHRLISMERALAGGGK